MTKAEKLANLPKEYVHYHCSDQERLCTTCGKYMSEFGIKTIRINVRYQPEELVAQHHVAHAYECKYCKTHAAKANINLDSQHLLVAHYGRLDFLRDI